LKYKERIVHFSWSANKFNKVQIEL